MLKYVYLSTKWTVINAIAVKINNDSVWRTSNFYLTAFFKRFLFIVIRRATSRPPRKNKIYWFSGAITWNSLKLSVEMKIDAIAINAKQGSPSSTGLILPSLKTPVLYWLHKAEKKGTIMKTKTVKIITL